MRAILLALWFSTTWLAMEARPLAAETLPVIVSAEACRRLVAHRPSADVDYQAGVDVHGRAVVPADLDGGIRLDLPEAYRFDLVIRPFDRRDPATHWRPRRARDGWQGRQRDGWHWRKGRDRRYDETGLTLGEIVVTLDGQARLNGQTLQPSALAELAQTCSQVSRD